ncbi:MAG: Transcriptional regulator, MarR family [Candidatus Saccharibacteria bacterium]|nr:Transcriptional regulator, MarR family [Candidatus Saccharibacteria bacterium]
MPQETSLEQSYLVLIKFLMLSKRRIFELGAQHDLTGMQAMTVFLLDTPRPMNNFKKIYNCDASNVTGLIDGLEQKQLVSRYEDPADRRLKMVRLEPQGVKVRKALIKQMMSHNSPLLSRLDASELKTFITLLQKITAPEPTI